MRLAAHLVVRHQSLAGDDEALAARARSMSATDVPANSSSVAVGFVNVDCGRPGKRRDCDDLLAGVRALDHFAGLWASVSVPWRLRAGTNGTPIAAAV